MALTRITKGVIKPNENYDTHNINSTGIVTAVGADFSGNVSVGGVLTYEDVTSIDSVGIITARNGIDCNGDLDVDGHTNLDNVSIAGVTTTVGDVTVGSGGENAALGVRFNSAYAQIKLPDGQTGANRKGNLSFGDNDDFRIVHDGHHNYITAGVGDIYISHGSANPVNIYNNRVAVNVDLTIPDSIIHSGDTNTKIRFPEADAVTIETNGSERFRINSSGAWGIGAAYGSSGQVLTSQGSSSAPTWSTITGTTINDNADNRVITGSGTANTLNGESDLTFNGSQLHIDCQTSQYPLVVNTTQSSYRAVIRQTNDANANSGLAIQKRHSSLHQANHWYGDVSFEGWDGSGYHKAGLIECVAEGTPANDNMPGGLRFSTNAGGTNVTERLRIKPDGNVEVKTGNLVMTSGKGIDFSADSSGTLKSLPNSFNAELLHDYENGTFTPNIQYDSGTNRYSGANVSSAVGEYIRIGDLVNFGMKITLTGNRNYSESIHLYIGGLPYNGLHSSQQSSMMNGWGGWVCPSNDNNFSYKVHYCYHSYTTVNLGFSQSSGNGGISGFYVWGFYRCAP